ncbi:MAG: ABC transporter permease [Leptospiraceae bacterium]|nr:ABC transporter permease [Leptospiraceae bacterium]MDW7976835.1 ABC transporter permease [Leptospiraceae bacterium]
MLDRFQAILKKELLVLPLSTIPLVSIGILSFSVGLISIMLLLSRGLTYDSASYVLIHFFYILSLFTGMFLAVPSIIYEKRYKMLDFLFIYPVTETEFITAKIVFYTLLNWIVISILFFVYAFFFLRTPLYVIFPTILGFLFLSYYASSIGVFASTLVNSITGSLILAGFILLLIDIGGFLSGLFPSPAKEIFSYFHAIVQFLPLTKGIITLKGLFFFFSIGLFFHYLSILILQFYKTKGVKDS